MVVGGMGVACADACALLALVFRQHTMKQGHACLWSRASTRSMHVQQGESRYPLEVD